MALFHDAWMEQLLSKNDIVSVVSSYVQLRPKGGRLWGLCPFHNEKTPSFSVVPDKQFYYCFGCHKGGGVIQFVMEVERLSYVEAVRLLAQRVGMELPGEVDDAALQKERAQKERLYAACKEAALFFHKQLLSKAGMPARAYLGRRGLEPETIRRFGLGFAPDSWDMLMKHLLRAGYSSEELILGGLLVKNPNSGRVYDAYRNRVIFPIIGTNGRVLGFGARALGDEKPKYINTGDTPIYNKRNNLYGLNLQKSASTKSGDLVMVEGYMDVISLYQAGVANVVASLGTALTQQQARLLKRYVSSVYISYDGDSAGQNATLRGLDILAGEGLTVRVVAIPDGLDPDDFVRRNGKEAFDALREQALTLSAFKLTKMAEGFDLSQEDGREDFAKAASKFICSLEPVEQERYFLWLARKTGISLEALRAQGRLEGAVGAKAKRKSLSEQFSHGALTQNTTEQQRAELLLLQAMLQSREAAELIRQGETVFSQEVYDNFAAEVRKAYQQGRQPNAALILSGMQPEETKQLSTLLQDQVVQLSDPVKSAQDSIRRLQAWRIEEEIRRLQERSASDTIGIEEKLALTKEINLLIVKRTELRRT